MFASKCQGVECHAVKAARCNLGDPAGEIPGFRIEPCCFPHPSSGPWWFRLWSCCCLFYGPANMTHKLPYARAEMITSYHLPPQQTCFTHKLESVSHGFVACGCFSFVWLLFVAWVCFGVFVLLWFFVFRFWFSVFEPWNVTSLWTMYRSSSSLLLQPLQHGPLCELNN